MMILAALLAQAAGLGATNYTVDLPMVAPDRRPSVADEFDKRTIDRSIWRFDAARNAQGWSNHELQYYAAARLSNARIEHDMLVIEARRETLNGKRFADWSGQRYSSARLVSRKAFEYGFYEIRAKLPCARGTWPAIWMLPSSGTWPDQGEIDVMEMVGWDPNVVHATLHTGAFNHAQGTQRGAALRVPSACTAFHRYQLDWQPHAILVGVDGRAYLRVRDDQPGGHAAWPFTRPFQIILNLAIGGDWGGKQGVDDAALPQRMTVDYVRYWKN
ncbi:glycoside hydrolase family 16 protein [Sphingomonas koreensis]|nr:glycoside hydrolase family 16 protein [Sphingomonas koreensis]